MNSTQANQPGVFPPLIEHRNEARTRSDDVEAVLAALRSDWIKASTVRANRALLLLAIAGGSF